MKITHLDDLVSEAKKMINKTTIAVVEAHDEQTLESVLDAVNNGIITPLLIGNRNKITEILTKLEADPSGFEILESSGGAEESLKLAIGSVNSGEATAVMKGKLGSADFMRAIVKKENGLLAGARLSVAGLFTPPQYHKLICVSDIALNMYPDLDEKKAIIINAVKMLNSLGVEKPKTAVLTSVEKMNRKMPETVDADALKAMYLKGEIENCVVEGPISFDLATSPESAKTKGYESPVAGDADILIVPDITAGNILAKSLTGMGGARTAGAILGAKVPIILTSRSAEASDKFYSIALAACIGRN